MAIFSKPKQPKRFNPWYGFLILAVLAVFFGLKIIDVFKPNPVAPTANVPAVAYGDVKKEVEGSTSDVGRRVEQDNEAAEIGEGEEVEDVAVETGQGQSENQDTRPPTRLPDEVVGEIPTEFNLAVPSTSQAPTGNWDALHEDACEEASFYMVQEFYAGRAEGKVDPAAADPELQRLVHAEEALGLTPSISLQEARDFLLTDSGTVAVIVENPSVEGIKSLISQGIPVIVPAAGRELGNPFFTGEGPLYHMFVIRGYTETTFITNDPGTRMGENYVYDIDVVMEAMGDWIDQDPANGPKRIMYLEAK